MIQPTQGMNEGEQAQKPGRVREPNHAQHLPHICLPAKEGSAHNKDRRRPDQPATEGADHGADESPDHVSVPDECLDDAANSTQQGDSQHYRRGLGRG